MNPATALHEPPTGSPVVEDEPVPTEPQMGAERPHPAEWYDTPEFRRQLMEHFTRATKKAVATNPPDLPG